MKKSKIYSTITKIRKALSQATKDYMSDENKSTDKYIAKLNAVITDINTLTLALANISDVKKQEETEEPENKVETPAEVETENTDTDEESEEEETSEMMK